ncbi:DUF2149 domain-containing protein [Methanolapillus millepedarum]|uniref:DUF2149 domain-containing protein n=1 Tax=Methanolapillus millepedarum TaxID=3028296 RepID=A0AA96V503_9EURY|nr:hypothetical protein MsAc7_16070 [Methanosarcinaceae archaeon Ac7]
MSRRSRRGGRGSSFSRTEVENPMSFVGNVFDIAMVFSVALLVALVMSFGISELLTNESVTIVKNPGQDNMQIITKTDEGIEIMEINAEQQIGGGIGDILGTAYRLEDGRVIYVPENNSSTPANMTNSTGNNTAGTTNNSSAS